MRVVIIGGGISGLSLAYFLLERKRPLDIVVLESGKKAGGKIWTDKADGFLCEGGVNGFLDNRPRTLELIGKLALTPLRSSDTARKRYIFSDGKLHLLPESLFRGKRKMMRHLLILQDEGSAERHMKS
jgi:oxygen-dependent protoporphyrinogen oxidase